MKTKSSLKQWLLAIQLGGAMLIVVAVFHALPTMRFIP